MVIGRLSAVRTDYRVAQIHKALSGGAAWGLWTSHKIRHNPADKTTSHLMLGLGKALRWYTIWDNLKSEHLSVGECILSF